MQLRLGRHGAIADSDHGCIEFLAVGFGREQCVDGVAFEFIRRLATEFGDPPVAAQDLSSGGEQDSGQRIVDQRTLLGVERAEIAGQAARAHRHDGQQRHQQADHHSARQHQIGQHAIDFIDRTWPGVEHDAPDPLAHHQRTIG